MRWEQLIEGLEAEMEAGERRELIGEVADRTRREVARLHLIDRLRAAAREELTLGVRGAGPISGRVRRVGPDWLLLDQHPLGRDDDPAPVQVVIRAAAATWVRGLSSRAVDPTAVSAVD